MQPNRYRSNTPLRLPLRVLSSTPARKPLPKPIPRKSPPLTNLRYEGRMRYRVMREGEFTGFYISMPYSLMRHSWKANEVVISMLEIGDREFRVNHNLKTVDGTGMPDSWFVDLSVDIQDFDETSNVSDVNATFFEELQAA